MKSFCLASWAAMVLGVTAQAAEAPKITPQEAAQLVTKGKAVLIDCREPQEWEETGVAGPAVLLAKSDFDAGQTHWKEFLARHSDKQILIYCRTGRRSGIIANALIDKGIKASNVGGLKEWQAAGLPTRAVPAQTAEPAAAAKK